MASLSSMSPSPLILKIVTYRLAMSDHPEVSLRSEVNDQRTDLAARHDNLPPTFHPSQSFARPKNSAFVSIKK